MTPSPRLGSVLRRARRAPPAIPLIPLLLALLPLLLGLAAYFTLHIFYAPVTVLVFRADLGSALAVLGGILALPLLVGALAYRAAVQRERRRAEAALQAERAEFEDSHRRFLRRLDHELKNPLTALRAALVNLSLTAEPARREPIQADVQHQVERLSRLVADLRKLAELEERPIESDPVNLAEVLEEVSEAACAHPAHEGRTVRLVVSNVPWPLPPVTGDRDLLGLVFYNLVDNALKFTSPGDTVEIRASEDRHAADESRWVVIEVADTGPGVDQEELSRLFDELYRGANARGIEGSGLGLSLVRRVIDRHAGTIAIRSRQDGRRGMVFTVRLPVG